jgi:hypothetical protein
MKNDDEYPVDNKSDHLVDNNDPINNDVKETNTVITPLRFHKKRNPFMGKFTTYPKIQMAQKCAWCYNYLFIDEKISTYNGNDPDYQGWMCHYECNLDETTEDELEYSNFLKKELKC